MANASRRLQVAFSARPPYVCLDGDKWHCVVVEAMEAICKNLQYSFATENAPRTGFRAEFRDGLFGALVEGTADLAVGALAMTSTRFSHFHLTPSFFDRQYSMVISKKSLVYSGASPLRLATLTVWLCMIGVLGVISLCITFARTKPRVRSVLEVIFVLLGSALNQGLTTFAVWIRQRRCLFLSKYLFSEVLWHVGFWLLLCCISLSDVRMPSPKVSLSIRTFISIWLCWNLIISAMFNGFLSMMYILSDTDLPFRDFESFLTSDFSLEGTPEVQILWNESNRAIEKTISKRLKVYRDKEHAIVNVRRHETEDFASIIGDEVFSEVGQHSLNFGIGCHPQVVAIPKALQTPVVSFIFWHDSRLIEPFQKGYYRMWETGLIEHLMRKSMLESGMAGGRTCGPEQYQHVHSAKYGNLGLDRLRFLGLFLTAGLACALAVFLFEVLTFFVLKRPTT